MQPGSIHCDSCGKEQPAWAVSKCPMCGKTACTQCGQRVHGRHFCSLRCADYFIRGDSEDEDPETET